MADKTLRHRDVETGTDVDQKFVDLGSDEYAAAVAFTTASAETAGVHLEDAAHVSGDPGVQVLSVRKDSAAATAGADGDYQSVITDSAGRVWTRQVGADVTNGLQKVVEIDIAGTAVTASNASVAGVGVLSGLLLGNSHATDACTIAVYDNSAGSGTKLCMDLIIPALTRPFRLPMHNAFSIGVFFTLTGGTGSAQAFYKVAV